MTKKKPPEPKEPKRDDLGAVPAPAPAKVPEKRPKTPDGQKGYVPAPPPPKKPGKPRGTEKPKQE